MLLFVVIPIAWLSISLLVLALCRMAARGDAMPARTACTLPAPSHRRRTRGLRSRPTVHGHGARVHSLG
jgi:hypothetical protein